MARNAVQSGPERGPLTPSSGTPWLGPAGGRAEPAVAAYRRRTLAHMVLLQVGHTRSGDRRARLAANPRVGCVVWLYKIVPEFLLRRRLSDHAGKPSRQAFSPALRRGLVLLIPHHITIFGEDIADVKRYEMREYIIWQGDMGMVDVVVWFSRENGRCNDRKPWRLAGLLQLLRRHMKPAVEAARVLSRRSRGFCPRPEMLANAPIYASRAQTVQRKLPATLKVVQLYTGIRWLPLHPSQDRLVVNSAPNAFIHSDLIRRRP
jgi:hypothetical protein